jgi:thioredoxin reductase (NADPH)
MSLDHDALSSFGAVTAVCDFVTPSPVGTTWGLGGTCVNVGCIPKKLMHQAALLGESWRYQAGDFGWDTKSSKDSTHSWEKLVKNVQQHITNLNEAYGDQLQAKEVTYFNALASFKDEHTLILKDANGSTRTVTAHKFVIAGVRSL